jgi:hypothetical protein
MLILDRIEYTIKSIKKMLLIKFDMKDLGVANINIEQKNLRYPPLKMKDYNDGNSTYLTRDP